MKTIDLYKFINDNDIEWHYRDNDGTEDVLIFPHLFQIENFAKFLTPDFFDGKGIECTMMDKYFAIWVGDICAYSGIELSEVFKKD